LHRDGAVKLFQSLEVEMLAGPEAPELAKEIPLTCEMGR
jgi:hypothetical protein